MNATFEINWQNLKNFRRDIFDKLQEPYKEFKSGSSPAQYHLIPSVNGSFNLRVHRNSESVLYHNPDPIAECRRLFKETNLHHPQLVFFFGLGLGYMVREFFKNRPRDNYGVFIIEPDPQVFLHALTLHDFSEIFENGCHAIDVGTHSADTKVRLVRFFEYHNTTNRSCKIMALPNAMENFEDLFQEIAEYFLYARDQSTIWSGNSISDQFQGFKNVTENMLRAIENPGLTTFWDACKDKVCISVAAGPGVNDAWDFITRMQGRVPIIACDTLLKPMNAHGISPDIITALERDPIVAEMFRGQPVNERTTLVAPNLLLPESFESFNGRHIIYASTMGYSTYWDLVQLGHLAPGSSAGNLNLAIASILGFKTVIMIGHNLAFALGSNESHVKGTIEKAREEHRTEQQMQDIATGGKVATADGLDEVYTIIEYNLFRSQIENLIAASPDTKFYNCTAKGAQIKGATYIPLEQAEKELIHDSFDFFKFIKERLPERDEALIQRIRARVYRRCSDLVHALQEMAPKSEAMEVSLRNWKAEIISAEQRDQPWTIGQLNKAIDEILKLKITAANENYALICGFISVIAPAQIAFEREINELPGLFSTNYDVKKEFIFRHENYFRLWNRWIPKIMDVAEQLHSRIAPLVDQKYLAEDANILGNPSYLSSPFLTAVPTRPNPIPK